MISFVEILLCKGLKPTEDMTFRLKEPMNRGISDQGPVDGTPLRSIIMKFLGYKMKQILLRKTCKRKEFTWQENHMNMDYDYPPLSVKKQRENSVIPKRLKQSHEHLQTIFPARLLKLPKRVNRDEYSSWDAVTFPVSAIQNNLKKKRTD